MCNAPEDVHYNIKGVLVGSGIMVAAAIIFLLTSIQTVYGRKQMIGDLI